MHMGEVVQNDFSDFRGGTRPVRLFGEDSAEVMWVGVTDRWSVWRSNTR